MKRIVLITVGMLLAFCVLCAGLGYFVGIPRLKEGVEDSVQEAVSTYVVPQIAGLNITPEPGTYTLSEEAVNQQIQSGTSDLSDLQFNITPAGLELSFGEQGQDIAYSASVEAVDGRIQVSGAELSGVPNFLMPTDSISNGVSDAINGFLEANDLVVTSVTLQDGSMTLVLEDAPAA